MNTKTVNTKRLVALAAVVIICAAALVSVAYAYNATYKDTVTQQGLTPEETAKYIYITSGDTSTTGLELPALTAKLEVQYDSETTVTTTGGNTTTVTKLSDPKYKITDIDSYTSTTDTQTNTTTLTKDNVAKIVNDSVYIKLGTVKIVSRNTEVSEVDLKATGCNLNGSVTGNSLIKTDESNLGLSNVIFVPITTSLSDVSESKFTYQLTKDNPESALATVSVDVYLKAAISDAATKVSSYTHGADPDTENLSFDPNSESFDTSAGGKNAVSTTLVIPSLSITIEATEHTE